MILLNIFLNWDVYTKITFDSLTKEKTFDSSVAFFNFRDSCIYFQPNKSNSRPSQQIPEIKK